MKMHGLLLNRGGEGGLQLCEGITTWCKACGVCCWVWGYMEVRDLPPFLSHLLFMTSYHCVSGMDFLGLLIFISSKEVCFLLKCMFWSYEYQIIFSWPVPKMIPFLSFQSATKMESIRFPNKFKEYKFQSSGVEVTGGQGRMWHWRLGWEIGNCRLFFVRSVNPVETLFCWHSENTVKISSKKSHLCYSKNRTGNRSFG